MFPDLQSLAESLDHRDFGKVKIIQASIGCAMLVQLEACICRHGE